MRNAWNLGESLEKDYCGTKYWGKYTMQLLEGEKVKIRPLLLNDVYSMLYWGKHENPLFEDYNFPKLTDEEIKQWFKSRTLSKKRKCFAVIDEDNKIIGYLTIKKIRTLNRSSWLGIVFDPNYMDMGYGTDAIKTILKYYFNDLKMRIMYLDVLKYNKRAIRCYEKCGFMKAKEYKKKLENQKINIFNNEKIINPMNCFCVIKDNIYAYVFKMKITTKDYNKVR